MSIFEQILKGNLTSSQPWHFTNTRKQNGARDMRPIYIGKNQTPKTVYTARKTLMNIRGFWHEKRMCEKTRISYLCFGKWCACATSLYLWPYTCSAHYVAGRGRVIPLKVTGVVPNNTGEIGASKKPVKFRLGV